MTVEVDVEFAFGFTWRDDPASWVWTAATRCEGASVKRGRSSELESFSAGTASIVLDNAGRVYDPLNADGPHYGELVPGVPVRVSLDGDDLFVGFVDGWEHQVGTFRSTVEVAATDLFKYLRSITLGDEYRDLVVDTAPWAYWPLSGADGDPAVDVSGNRRDGTFEGVDVERNVEGPRTFGFGATFPGTAPSGSAGNLDAGVPGRVTVERRDQVIAALPFTVECWVQVGDVTASTGALTLFEQGGDTSSPALEKTIRLEVETSLGVPTLRWDMGGANDGQTGGLTASSAIDDGAPHHLVAVVSSGNVPTFYIDGVLHTPTSSTGISDFDRRETRIGAPVPQANTGLVVTPFAGATVSDLAVYATALSAATIAEHYEVGSTDRSGEKTGERVDWLLDRVGIPAALRDVDTGEVTVGPAELAGVNVLDALQTLEATEGGRAFVARDGVVTFQDAARNVDGDVVATLTDVVEGTIALSTDESFLFDGARVGSVNGTPQYEGVELPSRVYERTDLVMLDDVVARNRAARVIARYGTPQTRAREFTVPTPAASALTDVELGDVIALDLPAPNGEGDALVLELFVESLSWRLDPEDYDVTIYGSPTLPRDLFRFAGPSTDGTLNGFAAGVMR